MGSAALVEHVRGLISDPQVPHVIGVCSPTGFTAEAKSINLGLPNVKLVLVEPGSKGGWSTHTAGDNVELNLLELFDPESATQKVERVRVEVAQRPEVSTSMLPFAISDKRWWQQ